jgi:two-component system sensor histidine kinase VicK
LVKARAINPYTVLSEHTDEIYLSPQFQKFFEKSANSMIIKANPPHFTILAVSDQFLKITGKQRCDLLNQDLFSVFPGRSDNDAEAKGSFASFEQAILTKQRIDLPNFSYEIFNEQTGRLEVQHWSNYHEPIVDASGEVTHIINTTINITEALASTAEAKMAMQRLIASEASIRRMVKEAPVGMCILKSRLLFVEEINDYFVQLIGKPPHELLSKPYWEVNPELEEVYKPIIDAVFETGETYRASGKAVPLIRNGRKELVYIDFVFHLMADYDGIKDAILIIANDVTDQIQGRKNLENAFEQVRLSKQAAQLGTFDVDMTNNEMIWDERTRSLFGIHHSGPVYYKDDFIQGLHEEDRERVLNVISNLSNREVSDGTYDVEYRTVSQHDGSIRWVRALGKLYFDEAGKPLRFIGSVLDITNQKMDEERKNDFIGMVSHELKTPLTSMLAYQQILRKKLKGSADDFTRVALDKSNQQIRKMTSMINGFLNISHLESGKIKLNKETFDMRLLLEELIEDFHMINNTHRIVLHTCANAMVHADREKISSVVSNLISNAIKYSPHGKLIEVSCSSDDENIQVSIRDEGMGIKEEDRKHLFERFYRISTSHRENISGFGIGLYLSKEIVERHGGKIWLESESGIGSTFTFSLPANV